MNWQDRSRNVRGASWDSKGREPDTLASEVAFLTHRWAAPLWQRQPSNLGGAVGHQSSVPGKPPGTLWDTGQQTERGRDASLSLPSAVVSFLLPHWEVLMISNTIRQGTSPPPSPLLLPNLSSFAHFQWLLPQEMGEFFVWWDGKV